MTFRRSYADDPGLVDRVFELLGAVWPDLPLAEARVAAARFGAPWEAASTPFVREDGGGVVSHVGLLELSLFVNGQIQRTGGVHGVATHPACRRQGLYRSVMVELLEWASPRYATLVLTTAHPEFFEPFGFRVCPEHVFVARVRGVARPVPARRLDPLRHAADRELLHRLIERRVPLSRVLSLAPEKSVWGFTELASEIRYAANVDIAVVAERAGPVLRVYDVIAGRTPDLAQVLAVWGEPVEEVVTFFNPDRMGDGFVAVPHPVAGGELSMDAAGDNTWLMVRGRGLPAGSPMMLARGGRC